MKILAHFITITKHRNLVMKYCFRAGIGFLGLFHDLSKYSPSEFLVGAKFYMGTRSPNDREREIFGVSKAWIHHKGRNKHHFEYWYDYDLVTKEIVPTKMPLKYLKEMLCDRIAASRIYMKDTYTTKSPLEYFQNSKARKYMHKEDADIMEKWLYILSTDGEDKLFKYLKNLK